MNIEPRPDGWWIVGLPESDVECGPYHTKAEANQTRVRLARFYRHWADPRWMIGDGRTKQVAPE